MRPAVARHCQCCNTAQGERRARQRKTLPVLGRSGRAHELNTNYWENSVKYCEQAEMERSAPTLFDFMASEASEVAVEQATALQFA